MKSRVAQASLVAIKFWASPLRDDNINMEVH